MEVGLPGHFLAPGHSYARVPLLELFLMVPVSPAPHHVGTVAETGAFTAPRLAPAPNPSTLLSLQFSWGIPFLTVTPRRAGRPVPQGLLHATQRNS